MEEENIKIKEIDFDHLTRKDLLNLQMYVIQTEAMFEEKDLAMVEIIQRLKDYGVSDSDIKDMSHLTEDEFAALYPPKPTPPAYDKFPEYDDDSEYDEETR